MVWRTKVQATVQGCSFLHLFIFYLCCSNFVKMEKMLWMEDIVESTQAFPFLTNSRIDMVTFVDLKKVVTTVNSL
jgi:hypothetical protein